MAFLPPAGGGPNPSTPTPLGPPPSEADIAAFQAQASMSMSFLRNLVGQYVEGYVPPTEAELADNRYDPCPPLSLSLSLKVLVSVPSY